MSSADGWDVQTFSEGYDPAGHVHTSIPCGDVGDVIVRVMDFLDHAEDGDVLLIRRGPQVESADGFIGPYRLVPVEGSN